MPSELNNTEVQVQKARGESGYPLAFQRSAVVMSADENYTVPTNQVDGNILTVTSGVSLTAQRNLVLPLVDGAIYVIHNNTSGAQSIQAIAASGTGVVIANGKTAMVYCDGTNYRRITADNP